jgi:glutathione peroxidase
MIALMIPASVLFAGCAASMASLTPSPAAKAGSLYDFKMVDIEGKDVELSHYKGKVLLIVNVASKCGNTPQYSALEAMYEKYKGKGFAVLGFPANQFGAQEPGTNAQIKEFCEATYHVKFPMFSKIVVKGEGIHPLYQWLIANSDSPNEEIQWNFEKFLVSRDGKVLKRFSPRTQPDSAEVTGAVESALASQ